MIDVLLPANSLSHSQIKSKIWLAQKLSAWIKLHIKEPADDYTMNWYGSWVGVGPFLFLAQSPLRFLDINLVDLDQSSLTTSISLLEYWRCEWARLHPIHQDFNDFSPSRDPHQFFFNTSCEHDSKNQWLTRIPKGSYVVLHSTNMQDLEHINCAQNLGHFTSMYQNELNLLESDQLDFKYPDKTFSRFMLFGIKK